MKEWKLAEKNDYWMCFFFQHFTKICIFELAVMYLVYKFSVYFRLHRIKYFLFVFCFFAPYTKVSPESSRCFRVMWIMVAQNLAWVAKHRLGCSRDLKSGKSPSLEIFMWLHEVETITFGRAESFDAFGFTPQCASAPSV